MSISENNVDIVEQERLRRGDELTIELGSDWATLNAPGSFGCHELLDRAALLADLLERQILDHPACVANAEWYRRAEEATSALQSLYQMVGAEHLRDDDLAS